MKRAARVFVSGLILSLLLSGADIAGVWTGQVPGRDGEKQDISFQIKLNKNALTGKMFGDEFDVPIQDLQVSGDRISFYVTTTNYYDGSQTKFVFSGTVAGKEMQLTRERPGVESAGPDAKKRDAKQTFTVKRLT